MSKVFSVRGMPVDLEAGQILAHSGSSFSD
jgi:hypothetical protein